VIFRGSFALWCENVCLALDPDEFNRIVIEFLTPRL